MAELKAFFKADAGLELNVSKTSILPKGTTAQAAFDVAQGIITASPDLTHLSADLALASFCPEGFVGIGVPIGTDIFVRDFVAKTCRDVIDDVEKLDAIQDGFIHFQLLRFCQATRLQYKPFGQWKSHFKNQKIVSLLDTQNTILVHTPSYCQHYCTLLRTTHSGCYLPQLSRHTSCSSLVISRTCGHAVT